MDLPESVLGFGLVVIIGAIIMAVISYFSMRETSFEDVVAKQRRQKELEEKERSNLNKQKREQYKRKFDSKKKKGTILGASDDIKSSPIMESVSPTHEVQVKTFPVQSVEEAAKVAKRKPSPVSKAKKDAHLIKEAPVTAEKVQTVPEKILKSVNTAETKSEVKELKPTLPKKEKATALDTKLIQGQNFPTSTPQLHDVKSKKKKFKKYMEENSIVDVVRSADMDEETVQLLLDLLSKQSEDWLVAGANERITKQKYEELQKELGNKDSDIKHHINQSITYKQRISELNQIIEAKRSNEIQSRNVTKKLKNDIDVLHAQIKQIQDDNSKEINHLQAQLKLISGKENDFQKLKDENEILRATIQANAKEVSEKSQLTHELQTLQSRLMESSNSRMDMECRMKEYTDSLKQTQANAELSYSKQMEEITKKLHEAQDKHKGLEIELQKAQCELQFSQAESAKLLNQVVMLNEANDQRSSLEKDYRNLVESRCALEKRLQEIEMKDTKTEEEINKLMAQNKGLRMQVEDLVAKNRQLTDETNAVKQATNKTIEKLQQSANEVKCEQSESESEKELEAARFAEVEKLKKKNNDLRERNWKAMDAVSAAEKLARDKVAQCKEDIAEAKKEIEETLKGKLMIKFPQICLEEKEFDQWLHQFLLKINDLITTTNNSMSDLNIEKMKLLEKRNSILEDKAGLYDNMRPKIDVLQGSLNDAVKRYKKNEEQTEHAERLLQEKKIDVEKYQSILAETEGILTSLQGTVEREEEKRACKAEADEKEKAAAILAAENLKEKAEKKLKEKSDMLEKVSADCERYKVEINELRMELNKTEQKYHSLEASSKEKDLECTKFNLAMNQENGHDDEIAKLKERLEKEKALTKSLGAAAGKLQTVLKQTQEQLNKEREKNEASGDCPTLSQYVE